jgi:hypothetical protein
MPERSRKKRLRDINTLAAAIVAEATDEDREPEDPYEGKNPAAVELGRRGGLKGGRARAESLLLSSGARSRGRLRPHAGARHAGRANEKIRAL